MGDVQDIMMMILLIGGGYYLYTNGYLDSLLKAPAAPTPASAPATPAPAPAPTPRRSGGGGREAPEPETAAPAPSTPAPAAGSGAGAPGDCTKTRYTATGRKVDNSKRTKNGTRHYASGKPDDVTQEWGTSVDFKNYEFTAYFTIGKVDHDDAVSFKFGGSHMGSGWFDCGINFNSGNTCLGTEKKHPSAELCTVKGKSYGSIVGKKIGLTMVLFNAGTPNAQLELWVDPTASGKWEKSIPRSAKGVAGWAPASAKQECTIRIDAAPQITMHCSSINEIQPASGGGGAASSPITPAAAPAKSNYARSNRVSYY